MCAWYGDFDGRTLYFGESAFWAAMRAAGGDPSADLRLAGSTKRIGRFDLGLRRMEPPIELDVAGGSGVWDVLATPEGIVFTTFFGPAGRVDPASGSLAVFDSLGLGLNELAPGPGGSLLASRYGSGAGGSGSVVRFSPEGGLLAELELTAPEGRIAAPKTVAWDPVRHEIWVTVDLLSTTGDAPATDARRLSGDGVEIERITLPEIQFAAFDEDGAGYLAALEGRLLELLVLDPHASGPPLEAARRLTLDREFGTGFDFVQDIHPASDGRVVVTRWSGAVHVVDPDAGRIETLRLPHDDSDLYYSGGVAGRVLCATVCAGITVVCTDLP